MIPKRILNKTVRTTRTRKFKIRNINKVHYKTPKAQKTILMYFNYGLKYLYQHYGVAHLRDYFPTGMKRKYLINKMVRFARCQAAKHGKDLKATEFNIQSVDKMLENLCVNFLKYRNDQYKRLHYWSKKEKKRYLRKHNCNLIGYGRISFKHHLDDVKCFTFKANGNRIYLVNNYCIHMPYIGNVQTCQSIAYAKHKHIMEVRIKLRKSGDCELQIITRMVKQKHITKQQAKKTQGLDVNSKNNKFFAFSDGLVVSWPPYVERKYKYYDNKTRKLQSYITDHNDGRDDSKKAKLTKRLLRKTKAKCTYMIDTWQIKLAHGFARMYPSLSMEHLRTFTMRLSKRDKRYRLRKNTNHKLATIHPTRFRKIMEDIYEDEGDLLIEVNPAYTSKTCYYDGKVNFKLKLQKKWVCPFCGQLKYRDYNSTWNIKDWGVNPSHHVLIKLHKKYPKTFRKVKASNLVAYI